MARMALDAELDGMTPSPSAHEDDGCEEKMKALRLELERLIDVDGLGLLDKSKGAIIKLLNKHCPDTWHRDGGAKARDAEPAERDPDGLKHFLRGRGLSEDDLDEVDEIIAQAIKERGEVTDELPVAGAERRVVPAQRQHRDQETPRGWRDNISAQRVRHGQLFEEVPDMAKVGTAVPGAGQFDDIRGRSTRRARQLAADASADGAGERLAAKFGAHFAEVGVGEWPKRF